MLHLTPISLRSSETELSENGKSLSEEESEGTLQRFEFIAEEVHVNDSSQLSDSPSKLHFVPETGTSRPNGTLRDLIRSNARRKPRRRARKSGGLTNLQPRRKENHSKNAQPFELCGKHSPIEYHSDATNERFYRGPECNAIDPFHTLPISEEGQSQFLIYHYDSVFAETDSPVNPKKEWIPFALTDPALLHVTLLFSAWQLLTLQGKPPTPVVMYHKAESIRWMNKSIRKSNYVAADAIIAGASCLLKFESLTANISGVKIHIDGLEALVASRGGIHALPYHGHARKIATWSDSEASIVLDTKPRFILPSLENEERPEDWGLKSSLAMLYEARLFHLTGSQELSEETVKVYRGIRNLMGLKDASIHLTWRVEYQSWSDMVERIERRLIELLQSKVVKSGGSKFLIFLLFGHAALIHIYMFMRDIPRGLPFFHLISGRLRSNIEALNLEHLHKDYPEMVIWILLMGGLGSNGGPDRGWFAKRFADTCMAAGLRGGNSIAHAIAEYLWSDLYRSPVTIGFWNDVARAQGMEGGSFDVKRITDHLSVAAFNAPPEMLVEIDE